MALSKQIFTIEPLDEAEEKPGKQWPLWKKLLVASGVGGVGTVATYLCAVRAGGSGGLTQTMREVLLCAASTVLTGGLCGLTLYSTPTTPNFNPAPGLAWSFYDGYLKMLVEGHIGELFKDLQVMAIPAIIILFPLTADFAHDLEKVEGVCSIGKIKVVEKYRGGQMCRPYEVTVYELHHQNTYYYVMLEGGLGIDHINQMASRMLPDDEDKKKMVKWEKQNYVQLLEKYASEGLENRDKFVFLKYAGVDAEGVNTIVEEIVAGLKEFSKRKHIPFQSYPKRMNVAKRIKDMYHRVVVTDKLVEDIKPIESCPNKFSVKLRGEFMEREESAVTLSYRELENAPKALRRLQWSQPGQQPRMIPPTPRHLKKIGETNDGSTNSFVDIGSEMSHKIRQHVAGVISLDWKKLYRWLMREQNCGAVERDVARVEHAEQRELVEQAMACLTLWLQKTGRDATVEALIQALLAIERRDVAEQVEGILRPVA